MQATPKPAQWLQVRFEDFVYNQAETLARLEAFLGIELARIPVRREAAGRWRQDDGVNYYDFLAPAMARYGYEVPVEIPGIDLSRFDLSNYYPEEQLQQISADLKQERLEWLSQFPGLNQEIINALRS